MTVDLFEIRVTEIENYSAAYFTMLDAELLLMVGLVCTTYYNIDTSDIHATTVGAKIKFTFHFCTTVVLRCEMSHSIFMDSSVLRCKRLLIQQLLASNATNNLRHRISLASKLSTQSKD